MKKSVKKNYLYNLMFQIVILITPLIVTPYISRILLADGIGQYSFSQSLINYFVVFAAFGFLTYGQREISKLQSDKESQNKLLFEILICRGIFAISFTIINLLLCLFKVYGDYNLLMFILTINIFSVAVDFSFYFQGNEDFDKISFRNIFFKIITVALIFLFIKERDDLFLYVLISVGMQFLCNISFLPTIIKKVKNVKFKELRPFRHLKGTTELFIPTIATSIYVMIDKTLIGVLIEGTQTIVTEQGSIIHKISDLENGYYEQAEKLVKMLMTIITCLGSVMMSRNSYELKNGSIEKVKDNVYKSSSFVWILGLPMTLGLIAIAPNFVPWFYGVGFDKCISLIQVFSVLIIFIGFSNLLALQYIAPRGYNKVLIIVAFIGCGINLVLNFLLIPRYYSYGACIASVISELIVTLLMAFKMRKELNISKILIPNWKVLFSSFVMFLIAYIAGNRLDSNIINTVILFSLGVVTYGILLVIMKEKNLMEIFKKKNVKGGNDK